MSTNLVAVGVEEDHLGAVCLRRPSAAGVRSLDLVRPHAQNRLEQPLRSKVKKDTTSRDVRMYVCMYVCMYVHMYVCMYVRMYARTSRSLSLARAATISADRCDRQIHDQQSSLESFFG